MSDTINVFRKNVPTSAWLHQVYDPDRDGVDPAAAGKLVLDPGSNVIDKDTGIAYYVHSVDVNLKHDIRPQRVLVLNDESKISIISYGNDLFYLFFDDRMKPTFLNIDAKLVLFGESIHEYRLLKTHPDTGEREVISIYIDADGKVRGDRIPMMAVNGVPAVRAATNCHTTHQLVEGESVILQMFDTAGVQFAEISLLARRATLLNDLASEANPIVEFGARCLQEKGDDFYIYKKQDVDHLNITPYVVFADGTRRDIPVDNLKCFIYGLDEFVPSYPGYYQPLVIKYFLGSRQTSPLGHTYGKHRYLECVKNLVVLDNESEYSAKIVTVPVWNNVTRRYTLSFFIYTERRDRIFSATDMVEIHESTPFNGELFGVEQKLRLTVDLKPIYNTTDSLLHTQDVFITLKPGNTSYERYIIKDSEGDAFAYGVEVTDKRRPVITYDTDTSKYFIPTTIFINKEGFLESFYYMARPMFMPFGETTPPTPTHFTIRDAVSGDMLITSPIKVEEYGQAWNTIAAGSADVLIGKTVVVEFLIETSPDVFALVHGSPCEVYESKRLLRGGFNTINNNLFGG